MRRLTAHVAGPCLTGAPAKGVQEVRWNFKGMNESLRLADRFKAIPAMPFHHQKSRLRNTGKHHALLIQ